MTLSNSKNRRTHRTGGEGLKEKERERRSLGQRHEKSEMKTNPTDRKKTLKKLKKNRSQISDLGVLKIPELFKTETLFRCLQNPRYPEPIISFMISLWFVFMILRNDNSSKSPRKLLEYLPRQRQVGECQRLRTRAVSTQDDLAEKEEEEDRESSLHLSTDNRWMVFGSRLDSSSGGSLQWPVILITHIHARSLLNFARVVCLHFKMIKL